MSSSIVQIGLSGIQSAHARINEIASRVANQSADSTITDDLVQLRVESTQARASQKIVKVGQELDQLVLDILA